MAISALSFLSMSLWSVRWRSSAEDSTRESIVATMIPSEPKGDAPSSEKRLFRLLNDQLDDSWTVLHQVPLLERGQDKAYDGEMDFVLLHAQRGVVVLEVKGGRIELRGDRWTSIDRNGVRHDLKRGPFEQCRFGKYSLRDMIEGTLGTRRDRFAIAHAAVFPDARVSADIGLDGKQEVIWDVSDLDNIGAALNRTLGYFGSLSSLRPDEFEDVVGVLRPTIAIGSRLHAASAESNEELIKLTEQQKMTMAGLRGNARALITGGAGTGKTVLAVEHAKWLIATGKSVGVFCYNDALGQLLQTAFEPDRAAGRSVFSGHIHGFMEDTVRQAGMSLPRSRRADGSLDPDYFALRLPEAFSDAAEQLELRLDAIVVDEGQDFQPDWLTRLELVLDGGDASFVLFADDRQNLYVPDWKAPFEGLAFTLRTNCRNTQPIAELSRRTIGRSENALMGATGHPPRTIPSSTDDNTWSEVRALVTHLVVEEHFDPAQIKVLCQRTRHRTELRGTDVAGSRFVSFEDADRDGVLVETIHKFKGLETDVAIVLLDSLGSEKERVLGYVGISRAKTLLFIVAPPDVIRVINETPTL